jgi:hypothetical protein
VPLVLLVVPAQAGGDALDDLFQVVEVRNGDRFGTLVQISHGHGLVDPSDVVFTIAIHDPDSFPAHCI